MKAVSTLAALISVGVIQSGALAGTACDNSPDSILCEDFDSYCGGFNDPCPGGAGTGNATMLRHAWPKSSMDYYMNPMEVCGQDWMIEESQSLLNSAPFGGRQPNEGDESGSQLPQASRSMVAGIKAKFGSQYDQVLGTDDAPLELYFTLSGGLKGASKLQGSNGYMELALEEEVRTRPGDLDPEVTPTDYVMVGVDQQNPNYPGCISCYRMCQSPNYSVSVPWPTICQSYSARTASPACPPVPETKIHKTLAIGALALLDNDPCHCDTPTNQMPRNEHLSYFDGWKWRILKSGVGTGGNGGDFILGNKFDEVWFTVKTDTVSVRHKNTTWTGTTWVNAESTTTLPRLYTGAFNTLRAGTSSGCELKNDVYQCKQWAGTRCHRTGGSRCDNGTYQPDAARYVSFDTVLLNGGEPSGGTGACCLSNGTCADNKTRAECDALQGESRGFQTACGDGSICNGACCAGLAACEDDKKITDCPQTFRGYGSVCADGCPCPDPFADTDLDGDVDQDDFAVFQRCFGGPDVSVSGSCACFDRHPAGAGDQDVDTEDLSLFEACASGPGVPLNPACD